MQKVYPFKKSNEHEVYLTAVRNARLYAREMNHDVALIQANELGVNVMRFYLASKNDSDYAKAEIVRPSDPL